VAAIKVFLQIMQENKGMGWPDFYIFSHIHQRFLTGIVIFGRWKQKYKIRDFIALFSGQRKNSCRAGI